jgi:leucine dehydrogenase
MALFQHPAFDNHEHVAFHQDPVSGLRAIIAVHNTNLGPSLGGCRMYPYASDDEAITDVLRLAKGMTYKAALANLPMGGGKSVIIGNTHTDKSPAMMRAMGAFVESLGGRYIVAEDSGIAVSDVHLMAQNTQYAGGLNAKFTYEGKPSDGNPAPSTAYGTFVGLKAAVDFALGKDLSELTVAIQGVGQVGYRLAQHLHNAGATLIIADTYEPAVAKAQLEFGAQVVDIKSIHAVECDVFAPCALGASINPDTIDHIKAKVIAGAANNQLLTEELGQVLHDKGITYAPDYVINAAGIIDIHHQQVDSTPAKMKAHIERIGLTLTQIFDLARAQQLGTNMVANQLAETKFANKPQ